MKEVKDYYPNGQLNCEGFIENDMQAGNWVFYYENGKVFSKGRFDNGKPVGVWTEYYENGQIKYEAISGLGGSFELQIDNLQILNYWTVDGIQQVVNGFGKIITYFDNGNIEHISFWKNKVKNELLQEFYPIGKIRLEVNYQDGVRDGIGTTFHENGNPSYEYFYSKGKPVGKSVSYYWDGQIEEEGNYINDEYIIDNFWTEKGEQTLKNGTGIAIRKYGTLGDVYEQHYKNGKIISEIKISDPRIYLGFRPDDSDNSSD